MVTSSDISHLPRYAIDPRLRPLLDIVPLSSRRQLWSRGSCSRRGSSPVLPVLAGVITARPASAARYALACLHGGSCRSELSWNGVRGGTCIVVTVAVSTIR